MGLKDKPALDIDISHEQSWQQTKSQLTRAAILEATTKCFAKYGYAKTTTPRIAEMANISRGAMTHHFKTREEVIFAGIEYLLDKRISGYVKKTKEVIESSLYLTNPTPENEKILMRALVDVAWHYFNMTSYEVHLELMAASRTDPRLSTFLERLTSINERKVIRLFNSLFPFKNILIEKQTMVFDLLFITLRGMKVSYMKVHKQERVNLILEHLTDNCLDIIHSPNKTTQIQPG